MSVMKEFLSNSYLFGSNAPFVEELYENYLSDPQSVPGPWREYFDKLQAVPSAGSGQNGGRDVAHAPVIAAFAQRARAGATRPAPAVAGLTASRTRCSSSSGIPLPRRVARGYRPAEAPRAAASPARSRLLRPHRR